MMFWIPRCAFIAMLLNKAPAEESGSWQLALGFLERLQRATVLLGLLKKDRQVFSGRHKGRTMKASSIGLVMIWWALPLLFIMERRYFHTLSKPHKEQRFDDVAFQIMLSLYE